MSITKEQQTLIGRINEDLSQLRGLIDEPQTIIYSDTLNIEISPEDDGDKLSVTAKGRGFTSINYGTDGLAVDVFDDNDIEPLTTIWHDNVDLCSSETETGDEESEESDTE